MVFHSGGPSGKLSGVARHITDDHAVIAAPFGRLRVSLRAGAVVDVSFLGAHARLRAPATAAGRQACSALQRYLRDPRARLEVPFVPQGTAFQQRVWRALRAIPSGEVRSYGQLARRLKTSARAVGGACRANPIAIVIPCHRVVAAAGEGGFMGRTAGRAMTLKRWLLEHERGR
jgi:methylated-DNA-[protein]-cysteine S-methyltransferase